MRKFRLSGHKEKCHASGSEQDRADGVFNENKRVFADAVWHALAFASKGCKSLF